jgi:hypothetical protein
MDNGENLLSLHCKFRHGVIQCSAENMDDGTPDAVTDSHHRS